MGKHFTTIQLLFQVFLKAYLLCSLQSPMSLAHQIKNCCQSYHLCQFQFKNTIIVVVIAAIMAHYQVGYFSSKPIFTIHLITSGMIITAISNNQIANMAIIIDLEGFTKVMDCYSDCICIVYGRVQSLIARMVVRGHLSFYLYHPSSFSQL